MRKRGGIRAIVLNKRDRNSEKNSTFNKRLNKSRLGEGEEREEVGEGGTGKEKYLKHRNEISTYNPCD